MNETTDELRALLGKARQELFSIAANRGTSVPAGVAYDKGTVIVTCTNGRTFVNDTPYSSSGQWRELPPIPNSVASAGRLANDIRRTTT